MQALSQLSYSPRGTAIVTQARKKCNGKKQLPAASDQLTVDLDAPCGRVIICCQLAAGYFFTSGLPPATFLRLTTTGTFMTLPALNCLGEMLL